MDHEFYDLLEHIRQRPAMYLGQKWITSLQGFLYGYMFVKWESVSATSPPFKQFHDWVAMRLGYYESTSGWRNMLLEATNGDEEEALDKFFVFLEEFKERRSRTIRSARLPTPSTGKVWKYIHDGDSVITVPPPAAVQIVRYTDDGGVFIRYLNSNDDVIEERYVRDLEDVTHWTGNLVQEDEWEVHSA